MKNMSYLGNVYRSLSSMLAMQAETGPGSAFSRFPRGGSEVSFSSPALS